ncbi:MAG: alpha/beta hydrolase, partial [Pseudomonadota bacterium]
MRLKTFIYSGVIFLTLLFAAHASEPWSVERPSEQPDLFPGEEMLVTNGIETLNYFELGDPSKPLVVFV